MPKLNIVWKIQTHHVRRYKTGKFRAYRLDFTGRGINYKIVGHEELTDYVDDFEYAKSVCLSDLAGIRGREKFFHKLAPTPTHEVIENEFDGTT